MEQQLADITILPWAIAIIAACLVVPFIVPKLLDAWERRQEERLHRSDRKARDR